jgi:High potential iron-sulfur protein
MSKHISRRHFLMSSGVALLVPMGLAMVANRVQAAELPHLEETDPTAAALGYKHDSSKVDAAKYPAHKPAQICGGCSLVQGTDAEAWRPCGIFPGKAVANKGWCAAFAAKPA